MGGSARDDDDDDPTASTVAHFGGAYATKVPPPLIRWQLPGLPGARAATQVVAVITNQ